METIKVGDIKKTGAEKVSTPVKKVEKKKTDKEIYLSACDEDQAEIFNQMIEVLTAKDKGNKREFEAVNKDRFEEFDFLINYAINGVLSIEDDGIVFQLRNPLINPDGIELTDSIKILFKRDINKENIFKKQVKTLKKDDSYESDLGTAVIAASFENVDNKPISYNSFHAMKITNELDYELIVRIYMFFRR